MTLNDLSDETLADLCRDHLRELQGVLQELKKRGWYATVETVEAHFNFYNGLSPNKAYTVEISKSVKL